MLVVRAGMSPLTYVFRNGKTQVGPPGKDKVCWGTGRKKGCKASGSGPPPPLGSTKWEGRFLSLHYPRLCQKTTRNKNQDGGGCMCGGAGWGGVGTAAGTRVHPGRLGTSEQILDEPRDMSWGHGGD